MWTHESPTPFLLNLVDRPGEMADTAVDLLWDAFTKTAALAEKATAAIRSKK